MSCREACCLGAAIVVLAGVAIEIEHEFNLNGDVVFSAVYATGAHPLHVLFKRVVALVLG